MHSVKDQLELTQEELRIAHEKLKLANEEIKNMKNELSAEVKAKFIRCRFGIEIKITFICQL